MDLVRIKRRLMDYFRPRRIEKFKRMLPQVMQRCAILDVGGTTYQWDYLRTPAEVTILNQLPIEGTANSRLQFVRGDGRALPYADECFDVVHSNSVIEHVGNFEDQRRFAGEMRRVGKALYCQTPNKWFFFEPHIVAPFLHWLPRSVQSKLVRYFSLWGWWAKPTPEQAAAFVASTRLLTRRELVQLFPDCVILRERFFGFTKSFVVVRNTAQAVDISR